MLSQRRTRLLIVILDAYVPPDAGSYGPNEQLTIETSSVVVHEHVKNPPLLEVTLNPDGWPLLRRIDGNLEPVDVLLADPSRQRETRVRVGHQGENLAPR